MSRSYGTVPRINKVVAVTDVRYYIQESHHTSIMSIQTSASSAVPGVQSHFSGGAARLCGPSLQPVSTAALCKLSKPSLWLCRSSAQAFPSKYQLGIRLVESPQGHQVGISPIYCVSLSLVHNPERLNSVFQRPDKRHVTKKNKSKRLSQMTFTVYA